MIIRVSLKIDNVTKYNFHFEINEQEFSDAEVKLS